MSPGLTLLVGGLSSVHDPLCAAALRGLGTPAEALHPRTDEGLRRARALGNHGQCNPAHYAVGAVLDHARRSGEDPASFAARHAWLTVGSCGPCRLASFGFEYARVLEGAGLGGLPVIFVDQLAFARGAVHGPHPPLDTAAADAVLLAVVAGDVLAALGHRLRPYAERPDEVDALLAAATAAVAGAFERRTSLIPALHEARARAGRLALDFTRVLPRAVLVGEPWTTLTDGDPSYDLARRLGRSGVEVEAPLACEWLRYRLWEEAGSSPPRCGEGPGVGFPEAGGTPAARRRDAGAPCRAAIGRADLRIQAAWRLFGGAAGLPPAPLADMGELAELAAPHYDPLREGR